MKKIKMKSRLFKNYQNTFIIVFLCFITICAYWPIKTYPFINFDDGLYVEDNTHVNQGLSLKNIIWAFSPSTSGPDAENNQIDYWHPLAWISHMIDCQIFGVDPHLHHMSNLFFHVINTLLLFMALAKMTGATWKSFFVAILFALHPINVDSTVWISERKNLLSTTFWILTMLTYVYYAKRPSVARYLLLFLTFGLGLLAKPMLVTLPCVLMLLDYWPLYRLQWGQLQEINKLDLNERAVPPTNFSKASVFQLIFEKAPLLMLSTVTIGLSMSMLHKIGQVHNKLIVPMQTRIENALVSYVTYLYKIIWPQKLAVFYPFPDVVPLWKATGSALFLMVVTIFVIIKSRRKPYLVTGWLWYLGTLFPVIGLIQGGLWPAMADRWAYVPLIGFFIMIAWGIPDLASRWRFKNHFWAVSMAVIIFSLFLITRIQQGYWKDTFTLFNHAVAVTENNYYAYFAIGNEYMKKGEMEKAEICASKAIKINPIFRDGLRLLAELAVDKKDYEKALKYYDDVLLYFPFDSQVMRNIADIFNMNERAEDAIKFYKEALIINPSDSKTHNNLGVVLISKGEMALAEKEFKTALELDPKYTEACYNLGLVAAKMSKTKEAVYYYQKTLSLDPDHADANKNIADILFAQGDISQALNHYLKASRLKPGEAKTYYNIGVILCIQNHPDEATEYFQKALNINPEYEKAKNALIEIRDIAQKPN